MIEKLFSVFGLNGIHRVGMIVSVASQVVKTFEQEFAQDHDGKNAAIDAIVELLLKHKDLTNPPAS